MATPRTMTILMMPLSETQLATNDYGTRFAKPLAAIESGVGALRDQWQTSLNTLSLAGESAWNAALTTLSDALTWPHGGKRLRPLLVLLMANGFSDVDNTENALPVALALELIHTYSLVHDDLPCMDDDDLRRGRPTVHKRYNEATAVLVGDALLTTAFEQISHADGLSAATRVKLLQRLSKAAGVNGLIVGQYLDLHLVGEAIPLEAIQTIHNAKTGALLGESLACGAVAAGQPEGIVQLAAKLGQQWGLLFQVVDDILDVTASTELLGKTAGKDEEQQKNSLVTVLGLPKAQQLADDWHADCLTVLKTLPLTSDAHAELQCLLAFTRHRQA